MHSFTENRVAIWTWESKPAARYESAFNPFPPSTVIVALVVQVLRDQLVQLGVAVFLGNMASDPLLNPPQYHVIIVFTCHRSTLYPHQYVVVWGSTGLVFLLEEVVSYRTKRLSFEDHSLKKVMEYLGKFP